MSKDTTTIAESCIDKVLAKYDDDVFNIETGSEKPIRFRKQGFFGKRKTVSMNYSFSLTDDSGYIPFDKEIERYRNSGQAYQQFMRMAFPNGSSDKVASDYEASIPRMSKLDAINYINERCSILQEQLLARADSVCAPSVPVPDNVNNDVPKPTDALGAS